MDTNINKRKKILRICSIIWMCLGIFQFVLSGINLNKANNADHNALIAATIPNNQNEVTYYRNLAIQYNNNKNTNQILGFTSFTTSMALAGFSLIKSKRES